MTSFCRWLFPFLVASFCLPQVALGCYKCGILHNELEPCPTLAPKKFDADDWGTKPSSQSTSPWLKQQQRQQQGQAIGNLLMNSFNTMQEQNRAAEERRERLRREEEEERRERMLEAERLGNQSVPQQQQEVPPAKQPAPPATPPPPKEEPYVAPQLGAMVTEQQAWKAKLRETQDKMAQTTRDLNRVEDGWARSRDAQADAMKANADGTFYSWIAQGGGLLSMLSGFGTVSTAFIPNEATRKQLKAGKDAATVISATTDAAYLYANPQENTLDGAATFTKAIYAADEASAYHLNTTKTKGLKVGASLVGVADKIDDGEYKKAAWEAAKLLKGEALSRATEVVDGTNEIVDGAKKIAEGQDEKDRIAARSDSQKQNFEDTNDRMNALLIKKRYEQQLLLEEIKRLNEQAPKTTHAPLAKP